MLASVWESKHLFHSKFRRINQFCGEYLKIIIKNGNIQAFLCCNSTSTNTFYCTKHVHNICKTELIAEASN